MTEHEFRHGAWANIGTKLEMAETKRVLDGKWLDGYLRQACKEYKLNLEKKGNKILLTCKDGFSFCILITIYGCNGYESNKLSNYPAFKTSMELIDTSKSKGER